MKKNGHRTNLKLKLTKLLTYSAFLFFLACTNSNDFEREIELTGEWKKSAPMQSGGNVVNYKLNFSFDLQNDKLYLLQLSPANGLIHSRLNDWLISGVPAQNNEIHFNITDYLKRENSIELIYSGEQQLLAKIHCVNKLFIPQINLHCNTTELAKIHVKVKNAFNTEQQAVLEYTLYSGSKKIQSTETPVFISGNSENLYSQEFRINLTKHETSELKVVCQLYSNGKLFDQISDEL